MYCLTRVKYEKMVGLVIFILEILKDAMWYL